MGQVTEFCPAQTAKKQPSRTQVWGHYRSGDVKQGAEAAPDHPLAQLLVLEGSEGLGSRATHTFCYDSVLKASHK